MNDKGVIFYDTLSMRKFSDLFKMYRLKSGISTLRELCDAIADEGLLIEESTLSRWQNGSRLPRDRKVLISLLKIFIVNNAITLSRDANEFLLSAEQEKLSKEESMNFNLEGSFTPIFIIPNKPDLIGIDEVKQFVAKRINEQNQLNLILHGLPGSGKSSTGIYLAHEFQTYFKNGVLWIRCEEKNIDEIEAELYSAICNFSESVVLNKNEADKLIKSKSFLLVLDCVEKNETIKQIYKRFFTSSLLMTTSIDVVLPVDGVDIYKIKPFDIESIFFLFSKISKKSLTQEEKDLILEISQELGNLPLALKMLANQLKSNLNVNSLECALALLREKKEFGPFLENYFGEIVSAFQIVFNELSKEEKRILQEAVKRDLVEFSLQDVRKNSKTEFTTKWALYNLINKALLYELPENKYRIHAVLYKYLKIMNSK